MQYDHPGLVQMELDREMEKQKIAQHREASFVEWGYKNLWFASMDSAICLGSNFLHVLTIWIHLRYLHRLGI